MVTFVVLGIALMQVYGGYAVGTQKSKPIVHSMALATIITDLVTHLQLSIMNTSEKNNAHFVYETPHLLLLVMVLQILVITFFAYFGNYVYFSLAPPEKCCVISSSRESLGRLIPKISRFRKQYEIDEIVRYDAKNVLDVIARNDTVFLYDVPIKERNHLIDFCYQKQKNIYYNFEMIDVVSQGAKYVNLDQVPGDVPGQGPDHGAAHRQAPYRPVRVHRGTCDYQPHHAGLRHRHQGRGRRPRVL